MKKVIFLAFFTVCLIFSSTHVDAFDINACSLLDSPTERGMMSAMMETKLLLLCGRADELGGGQVFDESMILGIQQTDVAVSNTATDAGSSTTQSETTIQVNTNTGTICSAYNDSQHWAVGGIGVSGFSRSIDGGATFTDRGPIPAGGGGNSFGDPSLAWRASDGNFYFASLHSNGLGIWQSTDDCNNFAFLSMIHTGFGDDKEIMVVDNNPASAYYGRIYVAWTDFAAGAQIYVTYSDNGIAWSPPVAVSGAGLAVQGAWPAVAPNGDVYVGWVRWNPYPTGPIDIEIVRSTNGGASFAPVANPLTGAVNPRDNTATNACGRPALKANGTDGIRYLPSPQIVAGPDGCIHAVYSYDSDGFNAGDVINVYYRRSCNSGVSWGTEVRLNDDATLTDQWFPTISAGPSNVLVATWYDRRLDPANNYMFDYMKAFSFDGGTTWGANILVSDVSSAVPILLPNFDPVITSCYHGDYDQQVQDANYVYIQWSDDRNIKNAHPDPDVWFEKELIVIVQDPDLIVSSLSAGIRTFGTPMIRGVFANYMVTNQGSGDAVSSCLDFYLSRDVVIDPGDVYLGRENIPGLAAGNSYSGFKDFRRSFDNWQPASGTWRVIAEADACDDNEESDETNNQTSTVAAIVVK